MTPTLGLERHDQYRQKKRCRHPAQSLSDPTGSKEGSGHPHYDESDESIARTVAGPGSPWHRPESSP